MIVNERECIAAGVDPEKVRSIARRIERAAQEAQKLGLQIFGGMSGDIRTSACDDSYRQLILVQGILGNWSGGCGAAMKDIDGLLHGEGL